MRLYGVNLMTKLSNSEIIDRFIYDYFCAHGKDPEKWLIEQETGLSASVVVRNYPEMGDQISLLEKRVLELNHLSISEIAEKLNMGYQGVAAVQYRLRSKGHKQVKKKRIYVKTTNEERTYIHVKEAKTAKKGVEIDLSGCGGYIDKVIGDESRCVVYANCKPYNVSLRENQYEVVGV